MKKSKKKQKILIGAAAFVLLLSQCVENPFLVDLLDKSEDDKPETEETTPPSPPGTEDPPPSPPVVTALDLTALVTSPVKYASPDTTAINAAQYTGAISWRTSGGATFSGAAFAASTVYMAVVTLTAQTGYTFSGVAADSFTYTGAAVTNGVDSGTATVTFAATEAAYTVIDPSSPDLMVKFGVKEADYTSHTATDVENTFNTIHSYLQSLSSPDDLIGEDSPIALGDYIDLPALSVAGYPADDASPGYGKINNLVNAAIAPGTQPFAGYDGAILRLIVVGRNSFNEGQAGPYTGNDNGTMAHLVFQFQNLPVSRRMEEEATNENGYLGSEMRKYLVPVKGVAGSGNFSTGLQTAGVPLDTGIIWVPKRYVANGGLGASAADLIEDKIWLPTAREMFGSQSFSTTFETEANQARLEYYTDNGKRLKYLPGTIEEHWWESSPFSVPATEFCCVWKDGSASANNASEGRGCAPAFCVR